MKPAQNPLAPLRWEVALDTGDHENQEAQQHRDLDHIVEEKLNAAAPAGGCIQPQRGQAADAANSGRLDSLNSRHHRGRRLLFYTCFYMLFRAGPSCRSVRHSSGHCNSGYHFPDKLPGFCRKPLWPLHSCQTEKWHCRRCPLYSQSYS